MCSVLGCDSSRRGAQRFKLPEDPERRLEWVQFVFEVNGQRLRESSWTDITICREHFTDDCFGGTRTGSVQLRSSAVPSLSIKREPGEEEEERMEVKPESEEPVEISEFAFQCNQQQQSDSSEESTSPDHATTLEVPVSPVSSQPPEEDYVQLLRKVQNIDVIREKMEDYISKVKQFSKLDFQSKQEVILKGRPTPELKALLQTTGQKLFPNGLMGYCDLQNLQRSHIKHERSTSHIQNQIALKTFGMSKIDLALDEQRRLNISIHNAKMKGKYVVNENRLLQLFGSKCPLCDSNVKMEKLVHGGLIVVKRQCLQCKYRHQWKSLIGVQGVEGKLLTYDTKLISESEESDHQNHTEESSDQGTVDSDEDWKPAEVRPVPAELRSGSDETEDEDEEVPNCYVFTPNHSELCTECGKFFSKRWPHTCEHKAKPFSCNICGKRCVSLVALNRHSRVHNENYEHRCKYCHRTFKTKVDKITHQQIHVTEGKPYKCPDCYETFASNKDREIHLEDHRGPKQLTCPFCGIEFNRTLSIQRHLMVHTGQKPFKCSECQRGFNQASHLKSHMRLHTGERPFKCQHCDKCFNHNVSLKSHVQRYHTSNPVRERKRGRKTKTVSTVATEPLEGAEERGAELEDEQDEEEPSQKKTKSKPRSKRSTGRPIGRPKRDALKQLVQDGENEDLGEEEDQPESNVSFDSNEEEEEEEDLRSEKVTSSPNRGSPRISDPDTDFDQADYKEEQEQLD